MTNGSPALMRAINAAEVVRRLRADGPLSRADLVRATGLSKPTITNVVAHLEQLEYIERADVGRVGHGSLPPRYEYAAQRGQVLGIDVGADKTLLLLADLAGNIMGSSRFATGSTVEAGPAGVFRGLRSATNELLVRAGVSPRTLKSVVVGTPGVVSLDGIVTMAPQLQGWEGLNLKSALEELYDCPVSVEGEVSLSLQAEGWLGVARGIDDALFVHLGVGVGAALLVGGSIYRGANGGAGEIGLMPYPQVQADGEVRLVPLESMTGGGALRRRGTALAASRGGIAILELAGGDPEAVDASVVFAAARAGDAAALSLIRDSTETLAWGIAGLVCTLNPRAVIIGGGLSRSADLFLPQLKQSVDARVPFGPEWLVSSLGDEAVALGAVGHATTLVERQLFTSLTTGAA